MGEGNFFVNSDWKGPSGAFRFSPLCPCPDGHHREVIVHGFPKSMTAPLLIMLRTGSYFTIWGQWGFKKATETTFGPSPDN